jgi:RNA polymerase sigma factor (sigma-70 family)
MNTAAIHPLAGEESQASGALTLEDLFYHHARRACQSLAKAGWPIEDARDAVGDVLLKVAQAPSMLGTIRDAQSFLFLTARNRLIDSRRRGQRIARLLAGLAVSGNPSQGSKMGGAGESIELISEAISRLPEERREAVLGLLVDGTSPKLLSRTLSVSVRTISRWAKDFLAEIRGPVRL